jgi:hypothetical protein
MFGLEGRAHWLTLALIAVLFIGGAWIYRMYYSSTDAAIRHAESFLFRRIAVAQLAEQGVFRFFYTTNRVAGANDSQRNMHSFSRDPGPFIEEILAYHFRGPAVIVLWLVTASKVGYPSW